MFAESGVVVAIDNKITGIDPKTSENIYNEYMKHLDACLTKLIATPSKPTSAFTNVRDTIMASIGFDIGDEGIVQLQKVFFGNS